MGIFHTTADISRTTYIFDSFFIKRAALKYLKESNIKNKDEILKSYKKEKIMQTYPCWLFIIIIFIGAILIITGRNGDGYMAVPKMIFGVRQDTIGLFSFLIGFSCFVIWLIISAIIFHKDIYISYYKWFVSVDKTKLEELKKKEVIFKDGKMITE